MSEKEIWWKKSPAEFERFTRELEDFESLGYQIEGEQITISGTWAVLGANTLIRRYEIKIILPSDFPWSPPLVFEVGGRIPRDMKFHVNITDGSACLFARPERFEKCPPGSGIREFLNGPVKEFFFSQAYRNLSGTWPFDEWSHGDEGILEYYASRLGTGDIAVLHDLLKLVLLPRLHRQWRCPCNSSKRVTACHAERIRELAKAIHPEEINEAIRLTEDAVRTGKREVRVRTGVQN